MAQRAPVLTPVQSTEPEPRVSVIRLIETLLRYRGLILVAVLLGALIFGLRSALQPRVYTTTTTLLPQGRGNIQAGGVSVLLAGFRAQEEGSPSFYATLLESPWVLRAVADSPYVIPREEGAVTQSLVEAYGPPVGTRTARQRAVEETLRGSIKTTEKTGLLNVEVTWTDPAVSQQIALRLLDELNSVDLRRRRAQAEREREFSEERLAEAGANLRVAEERLRGFLESNRNIMSSPRLMVEQQRLMREIEMLRTVYTARAQAHDQARLEAIRDAPHLTVISAPDLPSVPDPRHLPARIMIGIVVGGVLGVMLAIFAGLWRSWTATAPVEMSGLSEEWRSAVNDLRRPFRWLRRSGKQ